MMNPPSQLVASSAESEGERRLSEYNRHRKTNRKTSTSHSDRDRMSNVGSRTSCRYSACRDAEDDDYVSKRHMTATAKTSTALADTKGDFVKSKSAYVKHKSPTLFHRRRVPSYD